MAKKAAADKDAAPPGASAQHEGYTVLARRYRPQTFADLVGQEPVARALSNAIKAGRVAHAYLFTGARAGHGGVCGAAARPSRAAGAAGTT